MAGTGSVTLQGLLCGTGARNVSGTGSVTWHGTQQPPEIHEARGPKHYFRHRLYSRFSDSLDHNTIIQSVKKTNRLVTLDESWPFASVSSEIAYRTQKYAFDYLDAPVTRVNSADTSLGYAPTLVQAYMPNVERVVKATKAVLYKL